METRTKIIIGVITVAVLGLAGTLSVLRQRDQGIEVRVETVERRDLEEIVTASGNIRARRTVDISSDVQGRVLDLYVDEGDDVVAGQTLLRLEPDQYEANLSRAEASLAQARSQEAQQTANLTQAQRDLDRLVQLRARDSLLVSRQQLDDARTRVEVQEAAVESASNGVSVAVAGVDESEDRLSKTVFTAPMAGKVTRLNVEEGETVIIGTMNNPGSLVLTISDLSVIEVVVQVDETEVSEISLGDSAGVRIDAFPDRRFEGTVTEIGNSAINPPSGQAANQQAAIDFEVVLTLAPNDAPLRPDLSATADIVVESRLDALSVPIIALTVRDRDDTGGEGGEAGSEASRSDRDEPTDVEGAFVVSDGTVQFVPVEIGIAGQEYFEVLSGLQEGDSVVAGPYQRIRQLRSGDDISVMDEGSGEEG
ncbi:MAG: efflux RND transporter periplasmic adaptor subunit [Gemmatimonadetes bacterium]|nr:efflux RND transporter periplasmic adaptor subunit [Gemmatimonadota bacterium]